MTTGPRPATDEDRAVFAELWAAVGVVLEPGDQHYRCPFHPDHDPSLHIDADGAGGSASAAGGAGECRGCVR